MCLCHTKAERTKIGRVFQNGCACDLRSVLGGGFQEDTWKNRGKVKRAMFQGSCSAQRILRDRVWGHTALLGSLGTRIAIVQNVKVLSSYRKSRDRRNPKDGQNHQKVGKRLDLAHSLISMSTCETPYESFGGQSRKKQIHGPITVWRELEY